jgi:hypothetical protein
MLRYQTTYIVKVNDDLGAPSYWNLRFQDIDIRLNSVETFAAASGAAAQEVIDAGIARIDNTLQPAINAALAEVATLTTSVNNLQGAVLTNENNALDALNALLTEANGIIANLESLGIVSGGTF